MKQNPLLVAVLALIVLGGLVYYTQENPPQGESDAIPLVRVEESAVRRVSVVNSSGETIVVEREEEGPWSFGGGVDMPADNSAIQLMITNLASLDAARTVLDDASDWATYGLEGDGALRVTLESVDADPRTIVFGDGTPTGSQVFARIDGDLHLYTAYSYARDNFDKSIFDWRDKRLVRADVDAVSEVSLDIGDRSYVFSKANGDWRIVEPLELRADRSEVNDLARDLTNAQMSAVLAEGEDPALDEYPAARPFAVAEVKDDAGSHLLTIGQGGPSGYFARSSDLPNGVYEAPASFVENLNKDLEEFRARKLFDFGFGDLSRIEVRYADERSTIEKQDANWVLATDGGRELSAEHVQALIDALRDLSAVSFPANEAAAQSRYGLGSPRMEIETTLALAGTTPERVVVSDVNGEQVYAARAGEAPTYEIDKAAAERIRDAIETALTPDSPEAEFVEE